MVKDNKIALNQTTKQSWRDAEKELSYEYVHQFDYRNPSTEKFVWMAEALDFFESELENILLHGNQAQVMVPATVDRDETGNVYKATLQALVEDAFESSHRGPIPIGLEERPEAFRIYQVMKLAIKDITE
ncbi:hypothetical protein JOC36_001491 [Weissella uvarum]|uniref:hypothetical protein n=1 Tax=Weissella uvarum TaxID=1479233 RepID=UPI001961F692|nr:hypothetical protein [Weissella uvarum]MBM7617898.1 hypothetical protein [Weissella uvarum]MCM0596104.1 hypothetical protein [Weissella uvarum]